MSYDPEEKPPKVKRPSPLTGELRQAFEGCEVGDFVFESRSHGNAPKGTQFEFGPWRSMGYTTRRTIVRVQ
jgi:hypothetical protein